MLATWTSPATTPAIANFDPFKGPYEASKFEINPSTELKDNTSRGRSTYGQILETVAQPIITEPGHHPEGAQRSRQGRHRPGVADRLRREGHRVLQTRPRRLEPLDILGTLGDRLGQLIGQGGQHFNQLRIRHA